MTKRSGHFIIFPSYAFFLAKLHQILKKCRNITFIRLQTKKTIMGFFQNVKNKLGIGGVSVSLQVPGQASKSDNNLSGTITLTTKSEQEVKMITVKMIEEYTTGSGNDKKHKEFELGVVNIPGEFTIAPGDLKEISFQLSYSVIKSNSDELKEKGGVMGALGSLSAFASNEKSAYFITAVADVKSAALDPSDKKEIRLV
jgi:hypothetical protein